MSAPQSKARSLWLLAASALPSALSMTLRKADSLRSANPLRQPQGHQAAKGPAPEPLWLEWLMLAGLFAFAAWLLGARGVWSLLLASDPTGITLVIIILFASATLWAGRRARQLQQQRLLAQQAAATSASPDFPSTNCAWAEGWVAEYWRGLRAAPADQSAPLDLLLEQTHGPHSTAWWVNGIQLKLGLLGKVIGFSILALEIGHMQNFDPAQSQDLLKSLTLGLGVALLTTMVGLVGNILLGLQLTRLDRYADELVAYAQRTALMWNQAPQLPKRPEPL